LSRTPHKNYIEPRKGASHSRDLEAHGIPQPPAIYPSRPQTTLRNLAARVLANGARVEAFPELPPGAPTWNGRVHIIPKQKDWDHEVITNALTAACREDSLNNIFCDGICSNKGRDDGKQLGATSAVLYQEGRERRHLKEYYTWGNGDGIRHPSASSSCGSRCAHTLPRQHNNASIKLHNNSAAIGRRDKQSPGRVRVPA
jgi:hypothetical protein